MGPGVACEVVVLRLVGMAVEEACLREVQYRGWVQDLEAAEAPHRLDIITTTMHKLPRRSEDPHPMVVVVPLLPLACKRQCP